ncbi:hypothetical protein BC937DRAFT_88289 [Endogone sp. FLAS-F59071]|nr:hypothetical protein BC937DRAFT_88289 [Endogone sp. FLAS-F59071]|eukprot:RUS18841.1 hypothetical protein BC937DRAFT_88289 [Endogone sp. FLAS-F59071]
MLIFLFLFLPSPAVLRLWEQKLKRGIEVKLALLQDVLKSRLAHRSVRRVSRQQKNRLGESQREGGIRQRD